MALVEVAKGGVETVSNGRAYVDSLANKFIVKPKTAKGIGGFVFDYEGDTQLNLRAIITDHYAENNTAVQDHIALEPIKMTLRGFVAELVLQAPTGLTGAIQSIQNRLTTVPAYLGKYTPGSLQTAQRALSATQSVVNTIDQSIARAKNIVGLFDKTAPGRTKQQKAYNKLQSLWATKQLVFVETPWGTFNNMAIESIVLVQDEVTKFWSDIAVTLKRINLVDVQTATIDFRNGRNAQQAATQTNKGTTRGAPENVSVAYKIFNQGAN